MVAMVMFMPTTATAAITTAVPIHGSRSRQRRSADSEGRQTDRGNRRRDCLPEVHENSPSFRRILNGSQAI
jgi:hypothetical protein